MGQITIKLLSDSCISSGETYNSSIDSDVCYDSYGLPFIPAKRLKGCLREAGLELQDFGMDIDVNALFGTAGNSAAAFVLGNAKLKDYEMYVKQLNSCDSAEYTHQQTVLDQFTYVRYQTRIERTSGTAEDTSFRAIRVMKKGLEFVADVDVQPEHKEKTEEAIGLCCKNLRSMGVNRTRGMGEVRVEYMGADRDRNRPKHVKWEEDGACDRLDYQISLKSPMLIKSVAGGQTKTIPYIDGAKILGMLAQNLGGAGLIKLQGDGKLICSNAYISDGQVRYTPVSASLYGIKNEKNAVRDRAYRNAEELSNGEGKQLVQSDGSYVHSDTAEVIKRMTVDTEIRYHHSRPQDKSIGHVIGEEANSQDSGSFYQMESIAEGQIFVGYILGTNEQLKQIYEVLTKNPVQRLGYGKSSEYGEAEFTVTSLGTGENTEQNCRTFVVKLNAPAILYNENGMYAAEEKLLADYIAEAIKEKNDLPQTPAVTVVNRFLKYCAVGGFNTTWGLHKPVINTFDAGTTLVLEVQGQERDDSVDIGRMKNVFLGERISEGYGEASFYPLPEVYKKTFTSPVNTNSKQRAERPDKAKTEEDNLIRDIATKRAFSHIRELARRRAAGIDLKKEALNAVSANLLMMCRQQDTYEEFKKNIKARFDRDTEEKNTKFKTACSVIPFDPSDESYFTMESVAEEAMGKYPEAVLETNQVYKVYVMALLVALKCRVREEKNNGE